MKYVFGPVPSRRLGRSLGIDTIPLKTCNWNCVYCQLGRTSRLMNERREYFPRQEMVEEIRLVLESLVPDKIDWVTFVGSGEPTLHVGLGWLIRQVKELTDKPVAVITNGSMLHFHSVQEELASAEAVLPCLDAGDKQLYRRINRPHPQCTYENLISGLSEFQRNYNGKFWLEVMLVAGLNDGPKAMQDIAVAIKEIRPDLVHLNLPTRPPAESWVRPTNEQGVERAMATLGGIAQVVYPTEGVYDLGLFADFIDSLVAVISRHPMRHEELMQTLSTQPQQQATEILEQLILSGRVRTIERNGTRYWIASECRFIDKLSPLT